MCQEAHLLTISWEQERQLVKRAKLSDVAKHAGVSIATASRVLSKAPRRVDPELANRVRNAADELGYQLDLTARALRTGKTGTIGIIVPSLANPYFVQLVDAIATAAHSFEAEVVTADSRNSIDFEADHLDRLSAGRVDSIVLVPVSSSESGEAIDLTLAKLPLVQIDRYAKETDCPAVVLDNYQAMQLLVDHLTDVGRTRPAFVGAESRSSSGSERLSAFREICGEESPALTLEEFSMSSGREAANMLMNSIDSIDSIICGADVLAIGLQATLQRSGLEVPSQISLCSFDNSEPLSLLNPAITSIIPPLNVMAELCLNHLCADQEIAGTVRVPATIDARESTLQANPATRADE